MEKKEEIRRDIDVKSIMKDDKVGREVQLPIFKIRHNLCLPEFGGKLTKGGIAFFVTSGEFKKKQGFLIKKSRPRGKVAFIPTFIRDKVVIVKEIEIINGSILRSIVGEIVDVDSEKGNFFVRITHDKIGTGFGIEEIPSELKMGIIEKLKQEDNSVVYTNVLRIIRNKFSNLTVSKPDIVWSRFSTEKELIEIYRKHWPTISLIDPQEDSLHYHFFSVKDWKEEETAYLFTRVLSISALDSGTGQHLFNSKTRESLSKVIAKLSEHKPIIQTLRYEGGGYRNGWKRYSGVSEADTE